VIKNEIRSLTGIRGIAALYVSLFHFYQFYINSRSGSESIFLTNIFLRSFFIHGYLAVDLFFILSAFVITLTSRKLFENKFKTKNYLLFMKKRWIRIYPSYFIIAVYGFLIVEHGHRIPNFMLSLTLLNLLFGLPFILGHLWSLGAEWLTYLVYPLILKFTKNAHDKKWNFYLIVIGVIFLYSLGAFQGKNLSPLYMLNIYQGYPCVLRCFGNYILGIAAFGIYDQNKLSLLTKNIFSVLISIVLIISLFFANLDILTVFLFVLLILSIAKDDNIVSKILGSKLSYLFGEISYPLYLINSLVFFKLASLKNLVDLFIPGNYSMLVTFIFFMLLVILLSYLFTILLEKPLIKYFNNRLKSGKSLFVI
jgi:peptidoglycan/LPS O-acetylase OafA/YrhL